MPKKPTIPNGTHPDFEKYYIEKRMAEEEEKYKNELQLKDQQQQEVNENTEAQPKKYIRNFTDEGREKQKVHLENIRKKAMEKKRELKEITLKSKLMKLEPKKELAKQYDEYINQKIQQPQPQPHQQQQPEQQIVYIQKPVKEKKKKIIYKEVEEEEEEEEEEEIVYVKKPKPKPKETLDQTLYKSSTEQLHVRAIEERIRHNLTGWHSALMPREY
jgi:hypothetical protein